MPRRRRRKSHLQRRRQAPLPELLRLGSSALEAASHALASPPSRSSSSEVRHRAPPQVPLLLCVAPLLCFPRAAASSSSTGAPSASSTTSRSPHISFVASFMSPSSSHLSLSQGNAMANGLLKLRRRRERIPPLRIWRLPRLGPHLRLHHFVKFLEPPLPTAAPCISSRRPGSASPAGPPLLPLAYACVRALTTSLSGRMIPPLARIA